MEKWARICANIVSHYNEGWANGFHYNIEYWEIWNEPDNSYLIEENEMWKGTKEEYFELYRITSRLLKKRFGNSIKVGGYGSCGFYAVVEHTDNKVGAAAMGVQDELSDWEKRSMGFLNFFYDFIKFVKAENLPLDFFSYHTYGKVETNVQMQRFLEEYFAKNGLSDVETHLNEWNTNPCSEERGTLKACADSVAMTCAMQNTKVKIMCYYDARIGTSVYGGLFNPLTFQPFATYYGFKAFGELFKLGNQVKCSCDAKDVYSLSAYNDGKGLALVVNDKNATQEITVDGVNVKGYFAINEDKNLDYEDFNGNSFVMKPYETLLLVY